MYGILRTDKGLVRQLNEDSAWMDESSELFAVADGMGGHLAGEVASAFAIEEIKKMAEAGTESDLIVLENTVRNANQVILDYANTHPECLGMGTTLSVLWHHETYAFLAHVGDSRIYRLRNGNLEQITRDHSLVAELLRGGLITAEEARVHPKRNIITKALGTEGNNDPDILAVSWEKTDIWLLCTDGLHGMVSDEEMQRILLSSAPAAAADELLAAALSAGGTDNVTFILCGGEESVWKQD